MGMFLAAMLVSLVLLELIVIIGIAGALFWIGGTGTTVVATAMLIGSLVAVVLALRAVRPRQ
jgi:membrane protein implicated in regulation of membrane protease activity